MGFLFSSSAILGSLAIDSFKVKGLEGSKGIILHNLSTCPYGKPRTLPISLNAILALSFPNVIMCATPPLYLDFKYLKTKSLFSSQKSISKSGIDILSGFKNLSKISPNSIGSKSVMSKEYATSEPAPEPLPGPTGILFFFAHFM